MPIAVRSRFSVGDEPAEDAARHAGGMERAELDAAFGEIRRHRVVQQRDGHHDGEQQHHPDEDVHDRERVAQRRLERGVVEVGGRARQHPEAVRNGVTVDARAELHERTRCRRPADRLVEMGERRVRDRGQRLVDEADDSFDETRAVGGRDRHLVTGTDRQQPAEAPAEQQPTRGGNVVGAATGFDEAVHGRVGRQAHEDRVESLRAVRERHLDASERLGGGDRRIAPRGGDELAGVARGGVELAVGAVDGAVLTVQDVGDRVAQAGEHEHETQRHGDTDNREAGATTVAAEAAHHHPPPGGQVPDGRHDPFEQRP